MIPNEEILVLAQLLQAGKSVTMNFEIFMSISLFKARYPRDVQKVISAIQRNFRYVVYTVGLVRVLIQNIYIANIGETTILFMLDRIFTGMARTTINRYLVHDLQPTITEIRNPKVRQLVQGHGLQGSDSEQIFAQLQLPDFFPHTSAAYLFALIVLVTDEYFTVPDTLAQFFAIAKQLPIELQTVLALRTFDIESPILKSVPLDGIFKVILNS